MNEGFTYDVGDMNDASRDITSVPDSDLASFFKRPVPIQNYTWVPGGIGLFAPFDPWFLYLNQARVSNRLTNYRNIRGKMHLRFMINGTPFHYGVAIAHAHPFPNYDGFNRYRALVAADLVAASQQPHIYIDPTLSQGGDLILPFICQDNSVEITTGSFLNLWEVIVRELTPLRFVNSTAAIQESLSVIVLAWIDDFQFDSPTDHNMSGIVPQSGDEYGDKPVSAVATALSLLSGKLVKAPVIGKYAMATHMASGAVAEIAKANGMSRPVDLEPRHAMEITPFGSMASSNLPDAAIKLSMDAKKEVTIDPAVAGVNSVDDMHLATIAQRESFVQSFTWPKTFSATQNLWFARVCPSMYRANFIDGHEEKHLTPSAYVCVPFEFWRGSMEFRFRVVASSFHRGRLRISYDPVYSKTVDSFNTVKNYIVDIGETKDFTIKVGWCSEKTYLRCGNLNEVMYSTTEIPTDNTIDNGTIKIEVFTALTSPDTSPSDGSVEILMFTKMCDDFEVASPKSSLLQSLTYNQPGGPPGLAAEFVPESGTEVLDEAPAVDMPISEEVNDTLGPQNLSPTDHINSICFGEAVTNWNQCLKRYCAHHSFPSGASSTSNWVITKHWRPDFPIYGGRYGNAVHNSVEGLYNYSFMTIMNWVVPAYVGWKGAVRWKYHFVPGGASSVPGLAQIVRAPVNQGWDDFTNSMPIAATFSGYANFWTTYWSSTWQGGAATPIHQNAVINVEVPYYNRLRFHNARRKDISVPGTEFRSHTVTTLIGTASKYHISAFCAAGEDFNCFMFLSAPICWTAVHPAPA